MNSKDDGIEYDLAIICREVDPKTGRIAVYEIKAEPVDDQLLTMLSIRSRINMELRYFATPRVRWEGKWGKDYEAILKRKEVTPEALRLIGGIVEI
jgi:hypothetical protein